MYRRFIATITAASIAVTTLGAVPAYADENDNARLLAAILGLAVVGKIIHDKNNEKKRAGQHQTYHPPKAQHRPHKPKVQQRVHKPKVHRQIEPRPLPRGYARKLLPGQCLRTFNTYEGRVRMFGRKCMQNNYRHVARLPQYCMTKVRTDRGSRRGYEARCLRREGYRLAHR